MASVTQNVCINIRPRTEADEPFIFRLFASGRSDLEWATGISGEQRAELLRQQFRWENEQLRRDYPGAEFSLVLLNRERVGRLYIHRGETMFRVLAITLLPEYRGLGIGTELIAGILRDATEAGKPVRLQVAWYNQAARSLYEKLGFRVIEDAGACCVMQWAPGILEHEGRE